MANSKLFQTIIDYYDSQSWKYQLDEEAQRIDMRMALKTVDNCRVITFMRNDECFTCYTVFPINVPEEKRLAISEFLSRANYGLIHGNFELDFSDGEIRYKDTTYCGDIMLAHKNIETLIDVGFVMLDRYAPGIPKMMYGNTSAQEAIDEIEKKDDEEPEEGAAPEVPLQPIVQ